MNDPSGDASTERFLVVNADDFGREPGINQGIIEAHERGIVTSASLMVRWPSARTAADASRSLPNLALGLHIDLGEWISMRGHWIARYEVVDTNVRAAVENEVARQLTDFRRLVGRDPTHLDSHQHVHHEEPTRSVMSRMAQQLDIPLRGVTPGIHFCGAFHGQTAEGEPIPNAIILAGLRALLTELPTGWSELGCHPGVGQDLPPPYQREREDEVAVLCNPSTRAALSAERIRLASFRDWGVGASELAR